MIDLTETISSRPLALYKRLLKTYVWRYKLVLGIAGVAMLLVAGSTAANAYLLQPVLDGIFVREDKTWLTILPILIVVLTFCNALGDYGQSLALKYVGQRVVADMQVDLFRHLLHSDISLFHDQSSGRLISRLTNDITLMRQSVSQVITGIIKESLTMLFLVGLMFYQSIEMSLTAIFVLVFAVLPIVRLGRRMRRIALDTQANLADFTSQLDDTFQGVRVVKAYGREAFESERARLTIRQLFKLYYRAAKVQSASGPIMTVLGGIAIAAIIWYGGFKVIHGNTTPGAFFSFIAAMLMAYRPVKVLAGLNTQLQEGMAAAARFFGVIDTKPTISDVGVTAELTVGKGHIQFTDVDFRYQQDGGGVEGVSFSVPPGQMVALVGASGSGKTTIMNLILRFYEVQAGTVTIDGQDIRNVTINSLRRALAFVSQEVILFNDTVRANIAYGRENATEADIIDAAKKAHAHDFIGQLPQGYDTPIGPLGVKLSGGQRQRLSIARAILKNAPILLLDEATSALDNASERAVQEALTEMMQGRTTLVIAHRLSTIQHADKILVLDHGHICDSGTHEQLLQNSAKYRHMQQLYNVLDEAS
jgi:subfamily B ATP-binding cassette protein MsbA